MAAPILGLDVGGANLKAATADGRALSHPFALWKDPAGLPRALADLVAQFPDTEALAVTMTGELCDCFPTKRDGVNHILAAVESVSRSFSVHVWGTDGTFRGPNAARNEHMRVAAANWHALSTYAAAFDPGGCVLVLDIGSTTTDIILCRDGVPVPVGLTDTGRMRAGELVYTGVRRTPVCAVLPPGSVAAELFATTLDAWTLAGHVPEDATDTDTADSRPRTAEFCRARLARMIGGDTETTSAEDIIALRDAVIHAQTTLLEQAVRVQIARLGDLKRESFRRTAVAVVSGSGEFLARRLVARHPHAFTDVVSLADRHGVDVAACAPAFAVAKLAQERVS